MQQLASETIDVTLPARPVKKGNHHPLTRIVEEIEDIFIGWVMRLQKVQKLKRIIIILKQLNLPKGHPARDMQDSFYITEEILTAYTYFTCASENNGKASRQGPVKIICPGKVYRRDNDDATHSHQFMQIEGLVIDENISHE